MPQGLQAWDAVGVLTLDITDRLTRVIGSVQVSANGSLSNALLAQGGTPWATVSDYTTDIIQQGQPPVVTFSGSTMYWNYVGSANINKIPATITYGVY